jgi:hypothetical protein
LPRTETIVIFAGLASLILGASASYAVARASEFRSSSTDANVPLLSGNLRVATFAAAEPWLQSHLRPTEIVITSKPYQVGWHAALGFTGYQSMRVWDERAVDRRRYLSDEVLQSGPYDWIVDFNQFAAQPESPEGPAFEIDYGWLQSRSYLHEAYAASDQQGRVLLYAFRHERS